VEGRRKAIWVKENKSEISGAKWWYVSVVSVAPPFVDLKSIFCGAYVYVCHKNVRICGAYG
jgi:hypothetical protein